MLLAARHAQGRFFVVTDLLEKYLSIIFEASIFGLGIWGLTKDVITAGSFAAGLTIARSLARSSSDFLESAQRASRAIGSIRDAMSVVTRQPTAADQPGAGELAAAGGHIKLRNAGFTHNGQKTPALRGLSLSIPPRSKVGAAGRAGAGKSTLLELALRFKGSPTRRDND